MKKIFLLLILISVLCGFLSSSFGDTRQYPTTTIYNSSQLIKRGDTKVYSITFVASANGGDFILFDDSSQAVTPIAYNTIRAEGSEATSLNGGYQDFSDKPLEFSTGLYLMINDGYIILRYE